MKSQIAAVIALLFFVALASQASAVLWGCFEDNEPINFCNPAVPDRTCDSASGCMYCMSSYNSTRDCYNQGNINACNNIPPQCAPQVGGNSTPIDQTPPVLTINNPDHNGVYNERVLELNLNVNEQSDVSFMDTINSAGRWTQVCNSCSSYSQNRGFREGWNHLMFRAIDGGENPTYVNVSFLIDSKKPSITKTEPRSGFADGTFYIEFREENPESLVLYYGNLGIGQRTHEFNIEDDCDFNGLKYICEDSVNLADFNGQNVDYWFNVTDVAGSSVVSRSRTLPVDTQFPVINSLQTTVSGRAVTFNMTITETNFESAKYYDQSSLRPRWVQICSRLKDNGSCLKKTTFTTGQHILDIQVTDEAGNSIAQQVTINV